MYLERLMTKNRIIKLSKILVEDTPIHIEYHQSVNNGEQNIYIDYVAIKFPTRTILVHDYFCIDKDHCDDANFNYELTLRYLDFMSRDIDKTYRQTSDKYQADAFNFIDKHPDAKSALGIVEIQDLIADFNGFYTNTSDVTM